MATEPALRSHLKALLSARQAHCTFEDAVAHVPPTRRGERPDKMPYSMWELVEHIRLGQRDILEYCRSPDYEAPDWPSDYWPDDATPPTDDAWSESISAVKRDRQAMVDIVMDDTIDLYDTVPSSDEHTYLREAILVADHNAYHIGQIVTIRRQLGIWPPAAEGN